MRRGAILILLVIATACGGGPSEQRAEAPSEAAIEATEPAASEPSPSAAPTSSEGDVCGLLRAIKEGDDRGAVVLNDSMGPLTQAKTEAQLNKAFKRFLKAFRQYAAEEVPKALETYDALADEVPAKFRRDVLTLRDYTDELMKKLASARTPEDVEQAVAGDRKELQKVVRATFRIDKFSRDTCNIVIAD